MRKTKPATTARVAARLTTVAATAVGLAAAITACGGHSPESNPLLSSALSAAGLTPTTTAAATIPSIITINDQNIAGPITTQCSESPDRFVLWLTTQDDPTYGTVSASLNLIKDTGAGLVDISGSKGGLNGRFQMNSGPGEQDYPTPPVNHNGNTFAVAGKGTRNDKDPTNNSQYLDGNYSLTINCPSIAHTN
jgi:hypothetical protein